MALCFEAMGQRLSKSQSFTYFTMTFNGDFLSRFVNWLSASGEDKTPVSVAPKDQDIFSRFMNRVSG